MIGSQPQAIAADCAIVRHAVSRTTSRLASRLAPLCALLFASCASTPPAPQWSGADAEKMVAEIRDAQRFQGTKATPGELDVQPLRDPMVEDLRVQAAQFERARRHAEAAAALDKALAISPDDPALLQERAEAALLQQDAVKALALAENGYRLGAQVGPLCRRHWTTILLASRELAQQRRTQATASKRDEDRLRFEHEAREAQRKSEEATRQRETCTQTGPPRY